MTDIKPEITDADIEALISGAGTGTSPEARAAAYEAGREQFEKDCRDLGIKGMLGEVELRPSAEQFLAPVDTLHIPDDLLKPRHLG